MSHLKKKTVTTYTIKNLFLLYFTNLTKKTAHKTYRHSETYIYLNSCPSHFMR